MKKKDPPWLKPLLLMLTLLALAGQVYAIKSGTHYKIDLRSAALFLAVFPATVFCFFGWRAVGLLRVCVAAAIMAYFIASGKLALGRMLASRYHWGLLLTGFLLVMSQPFFGAERWRQLLSAQEIRLSRLQTLRIVFVASFFNICLPGATGGDIFRAYIVGKNADKTPETITTLILDRLSGLAALIIICIGALLLNIAFIKETPEIRKIAWAILAVAVIGIIFLTLLMSRRLASFLKKSRLGRISFPGRRGVADAYRALHTYHGSYGILAAAVLISVISHLATIGAAFCFSIAIGLEGLGFAQYLLLIPLGLAINAIPGTPGGIGQGQYAFSYLFTMALPARVGAGALGAGIMTFIHLALFTVAIVGAICYALGSYRVKKSR